MAMFNEITVDAELSSTEYLITKNYNLLENKPQINSVELVGNKSLPDLGINPDAEPNVIDTVKVNGESLTPDGNKAVDVTVVTGSANGTVKVNGSDVAVKGLGSAAFTNSTAYDAAGSAADVQRNVDALSVVVSGKVDKVQGKGLSTNDYTDAEKTKLAGIQAGAQVNTVTSVAGKTGAVTLQKGDVGLGNVDNTSDLNKPVSTATQTALNGKVDKVAGKGLSTNDYTTEEKNKLAGISANAKNVSVAQVVTEGTTLANITIDGTTTAIIGSDVTVDDELSTESENPVQNKVVTAALNEKLGTDTVGELPNVLSGGAMALVTPAITDKSLYVFRTAANGLRNLFSLANMRTLIGGSVVWNQLYNITRNQTSKGVILSVSNGVVSLSGTSNDTGSSVNFAWTDFQIPIGHKVIVIKDFNLPSGDLIFDQYNGASSIDITNTVLNISAGYLIPQLKIENSGVTYNITNGHLSVIDLTQAFGTTIANYIYTLESGTAGAGVAWFRKYFPEVYYAYSAPTIQSTKVSGKKVVGFNQFDKSTASDWKQWYLVGATSKVEVLSVGKSAIIRCLPNTTYYAFHSKGSRLGLGSFPDYPQIDDTSSNNVVISTVSGGNVTYTTGANDRYLMIWFYNSNADTGLTAQEVADTLVVNLHWDGERDGEYEPYKSTTYDLSGSHLVKRKYEFRAYASGDESLPDTITDGTNTVTKRTTPITETVTNPTLYGIWKLDANNNLYFDGDEIEELFIMDVEPGGTEEYIDSEVEAENRDVSIPVSSDEWYAKNVITVTIPDPPETVTDCTFIIDKSGNVTITDNVGEEPETYETTIDPIITFQGENIVGLWYGNITELLYTLVTPKPLLKSKKKTKKGGN